MDKIDELLTRGVENIIPNRKTLEAVLRSGRKLNIYLGIDPTSTKIHIGHAVPLRKLQAFVELGHNVTFLIGDFTALIGDTSDKESERPILTKNEIENNFQTYKRQAEKLLDFSKVIVRHNREWLSKLTYEDVVMLFKHFSLNDFIGRELIKKRLDSGGHVRFDEVAYPVMQGYDSYFMDTDIQIGGTDQTFNMQAGRTLQKDLRGKESFVLANGFLEGTDGRKMSKSWGNAIWLEDEPSEIYGKVMSLRDDLIIQYFTLATNATMDEIAEIDSRLKAGENPMTLKKELAFQITSDIHGPEPSKAAEEEFEDKHQKGDWSSMNISLPTTSYVSGATISGTLTISGTVTSKSEVKRLIEHGAIDVNGQTINQDIATKSGDIIRIGKKKGLKIT